MAPEQALGQAVDARADLYALGVVLYEMLTGQPPFTADEPVVLLGQHLHATPLPPSVHRPETPPALEQLVLRLLAKSPAERPESTAAVCQALAAIRAGAPGEAHLAALGQLASGIFVGRDAELARLREAVDQARAGRGRLVLVQGPPGIGKTRTGVELAAYARLRIVRVLWGRCYEGEGAPPYWPWIEILRGLVVATDGAVLREQLAGGAADVAQVVPEVRALLTEPAPPPPSDPGRARFAFFDAVATFLQNAARATPLVLLIDDLQGADVGSVLLLEFLAQVLHDAPILVVAMYRPVAAKPPHRLAPLLEKLVGGGVEHRASHARWTRFRAPAPRNSRTT
jgi:hypothetical protein